MWPVDQLPPVMSLIGKTEKDYISDFSVFVNSAVLDTWYYL